MNETKPWYKSVTIQSIIVIIVIVANSFFGIDIVEADLQQTLEAVGVAIASVLALWGRFRAKTKISSS